MDGKRFSLYGNTIEQHDLSLHDNSYLGDVPGIRDYRKNKSIGLYDGVYRCVELATGKKFDREALITSG